MSDSWALSSSGRAPLLQSGGGRFESCRVHNKEKDVHWGRLFLCGGSRSDVEPVGETARRGRGILRATASKISVTTPILILFLAGIVLPI